MGLGVRECMELSLPVGVGHSCPPKAELNQGAARKAAVGSVNGWKRCSAHKRRCRTGMSTRTIKSQKRRTELAPANGDSRFRITELRSGARFPPLFRRREGAQLRNSEAAVPVRGGK